MEAPPDPTPRAPTLPGRQWGGRTARHGVRSAEQHRVRRVEEVEVVVDPGRVDELERPAVVTAVSPSERHPLASVGRSSTEPDDFRRPDPQEPALERDGPGTVVRTALGGPCDVPVGEVESEKSVLPSSW